MAISLQREMNRLFDEFLFPEGRIIEGGNGRSLAGRGGPGGLLGCGAGIWSPRVDVHEDDKAIRVHADLPGIPKEKVSVDVTSGNVLVISGENEERRDTPAAGERGYRVQERCYGRFERRIGLPASVDHARVEAKMENGVLNITLPKTTDAQARRITVK